MSRDWNAFVASHLFKSERCRPWVRRKELAHKLIYGKIRFTDFEKTEMDTERPLAYIAGRYSRCSNQRQFVIELVIGC